MHCFFPPPLTFPYFVGCWRSPAVGSLFACRKVFRARQLQMAAVTFKKQNGEVPGILYGENNPNPFGVIVVQEWWGLNEVIKVSAPFVWIRLLPILVCMLETSTRIE